jgi:cell division protein FtsN
MKKFWMLSCLTALLLCAACEKKEAPVPAPQAAAPDTTVKKEQPQPAPVVAVPEKPAVKAGKMPPGPYTIQVAAWASKKDAEELAAFYKNKGYEARIEEADLSSARWFRVRIGMYEDYRSARDTANKIEKEYNSRIWLIKL